jgi:3-phosphoshikimate 1-carboxyvinyltransferase
LAEGKSHVEHVCECDDVTATKRCLAALKEGKIMDAGESATTMRLLIPLSLLYGGGRFFMAGSLMGRPIEPYSESLDAKLYRNGNEIIVTGSLMPGEFYIRGDVSSQFVSGLLFALPLLDGDSFLHVKGTLQSRPYVELTRDIMARFGVYTEVYGDGFFIKGNQHYTNADIIVEGDWTYASNFLVANHLGGNVKISGLNPDSLQGDKQILYALDKDEININDMPDVFPALAVNACAKKGITHITGGHRLRFKESDRLSVMATELYKLGADVKEEGDSLFVRGTGRLKGGRADSHNDHRVAMALSIAAAICDEPVELTGSDAVKKSAPRFFETLKALGGTDG